MSDTSIEWTDRVWNPTVGCARVSAGCGSSDGGGCYAERMTARLAMMPHTRELYAGLTRKTAGGPRWTGVVRTVPERLAEPLTWKKPQRIFVNSMSDLFHEDVPDEYIAAVFGVMAACPQHTFQVLTKRPERLPRWFSWADSRKSDGLGWDDRALACWRAAREAFPALGSSVWDGDFLNRAHLIRWPLPNVWLGVSTEDQEAADERIPHLLATPAVIRFVSAEPLLGPVALGHRFRYVATSKAPGLDWVIVGGESGRRSRPFDIEWGRELVAQCRSAGVPVFVKQLGADPIERQPGQSPTDPNAFLIQLKSRKGGDMSEWPADLRVREFPAGYPGS